MNDYIGNFQYKKDELKSLKHAGAGYESDIKDLGRANYRNHRKMVIIDGDLGYTGGINVGQEYIDGGSRFPTWRDTHMRYTGQGVAELQKLFGVRWLEVTGESIFYDKYFPKADRPGEEGSILTQTVAQGVDDPWESARRAHMVAIANAEHHAWLQSPYFVPDDALYDVMIDAALGGVDIQLMMPGKWLDKGLPFYAAQSYFKQFLQAGGKIFIYQDGFLHSKTLSVDSRVLSIGTMNLDVRALQLHKELMVWIYNEELTRQHEEIYARDRERCVEMTLLDVEGWTKGQRFRNSAARLASNLL
jgi:cardiolipin synthase